MAKFKCKHTGCVYEWKEEETIANMRKHNEYEEIVEPIKEEKPKKTKEDK